MPSQYSPLRFIAIPFRSHPTPFRCLSYLCESFAIQFNSVTTQSSSAPAHRASLPFLYHTVLFHRFTILFCSIAWALLIITITALAVSFPWLSHNAAVLFYSIAALHFTLPSLRRCPASQFYTSPLPFFPHLCHCFLHLFYGKVKPCFCVPDGKDIPFCAYLYETT